MARVVDVAKYILEQQNASITTLKLQKLVYYAQVWTIAESSDPLFTEPVKAWRRGRLCRRCSSNIRTSDRSIRANSASVTALHSAALNET